MSLKLGRLRLRNVRSYETAELEIGPGVTVLTGDVGSGKTSLLHAVEMALFGFAEVDAPFLVRHRAGEASVVLSLADEEHTYELARSFRRKTRRGREVFDSEEPTFRVDHQLRRYSATEFRQEVIRLLGFPDNPNPRSRSDLWRWAVYTPQERMREILRSEEADERLETIRKALGLERYRRAADNAETVATALRAEGRSHADRAAGMVHFEGDLARADEAVRETAKDLARTEAAAADARRVTAEVEELLARSESDRRRREADRAQREQLEVELRRATSAAEAAAARAVRAADEARTKESAAADAAVPAGAVEAARTELAGADQRARAGRDAVLALEGTARESAAADANLAGLERSAADHDRAASRAASALAEAREALAAAERRGPTKEPPAPTPRSAEEIRSEIERLRHDEATAIATWSARRTTAAELAELLHAGICPRCHQAVTAASFEEHRAEAAREAASAEAALNEVREQVARDEAERGARERYDRAYDSWLAREEVRRAATLAVDRLTAEARERETERAKLAAGLSSARVEAAAARERIAPLEELRRGWTLRESERESAGARLAALERGVTTADALRAAAETARARATEENDRARESETRTGELRTAVAALDERLRGASVADQAHAELLGRRDAARRAELSAVAAQTSASERSLHAHERRTEAARGVEERRHQLDRSAELGRWGEFVAGPFRDALLDIERRLLGRAQALFEREFARGFSALVEDPGLVARCGPSFVPYVEIDGEVTPAEALSGGERTALALAFRLALGEVVRSASRLRLDAIVLDEPTDGFSPEQVERMGDLLRSLPWGQVVVVTHEAGLAAIADRTVRVRRVAGVSTLDGDGVPSTSVEAPAVTPRRTRGARLEPPSAN